MVHYKRRNAEIAPSFHWVISLVIVLSIFDFATIHPIHIPTVHASKFDNNSQQPSRYSPSSHQPRRRVSHNLNHILSIPNGGAQQQNQISSKRRSNKYQQGVVGVVVDNDGVVPPETTKNNRSLTSLKGGTHTDPKLLNLFRLLYITFYGSLGALMPYLPVYFHSLGHDGQAIGILGAVKPMTTFLVAPIWGIVADYMQNPNLILQLTFAISFVFQSLLPLKNDVRFLVWMVFITALFNAPVKSLVDSLVLSKLSDEDRGQYGKLRLWGQLGFGLGSSAVGYLIGRSSPTTTTTTSAPTLHQAANQSPSAERFVQSSMDILTEAGMSAAATEEMTSTALETLSTYLSSSIEFLRSVRGFKIAFLAHAVLSLPVIVCLRVFQRYYTDSGSGSMTTTTTTASNKSKKNKITTKKEEGKAVNILEGLNLLFHNSDAVLFFFLVFIVGTASGIIENFAYVRLREVGGTGKEMGACRLASSLAGAPMFYFSAHITETFGVDQVLVLSLFSYMVRFLNYALMKSPYHCLPAEALRGITFAAFWSTGTVYAHKISPKGMTATMLMFMNAMYGGLGQSVGAIIGGKLQSMYGTVKTFLYSAAFDLVFICFVTIYLKFRKESNFRDPTPIGS